eukprot:COSAG01_NODE_6596_length_3588_cov_1.782459_2_plen_308_part_00
MYIETSAKTGASVRKMMQMVAQRLVSVSLHGRVPALIRAKGLDLQGLYRKLLAEAKQQLLRSKLLLVGPGRAGKTSVVKRVTGQQFQEGEESTSGIEVNVHLWSCWGGGNEPDSELNDALGRKALEEIRKAPDAASETATHRRRRGSDGGVAGAEDSSQEVRTTQQPPLQPVSVSLAKSPKKKGLRQRLLDGFTHFFPVAIAEPELEPSPESEGSYQVDVAGASAQADDNRNDKPAPERAITAPATRLIQFEACVQQRLEREQGGRPGQDVDLRLCWAAHVQTHGAAVHHAQALHLRGRVQPRNGPQ